MNPIHWLREWWHGRADARERVTEIRDDPDVYDGFNDDTDEPDECPAGGPHEPREVRAATSREALYVYCGKCREELPREGQ